MATKLAAAADAADKPDLSQDAPPAPAKPKPAAPQVMLVLDTTATEGLREHQMMVNKVVRTFKFEPGKGLPLPPAIAVKFLRHEAFKHVDDAGNILDWQRRPRQPNELEAGESLKIADYETVARVDELATGALLRRALEMPGGEQFGPKSDRQAMVDFIVATTTALNKARMAQPDKLDAAGADTIGGEFTPESEADDEMAA